MRATRPLFALIVLAGCTPSDGGITKFNNDPVATITSHEDGDAVDEGVLVTFRGTISDTNDGPENLVATWYSGAEELCATAPVAEDGTTLCEVALGLDDTEIVLEGQDDENASATARLTLVVSETDAPSADITAPSGEGGYYSDEPVTIEAIVGDGEDAPTDLVVAWTDAAGEPLDLDTEPDASGNLVDALTLAAGDHALVLTVTDTSGKTTSDRVDFTVLDPSLRPPEVTIETPTEGDLYNEGDVVAFLGAATDDGSSPDTLSVVWESDVDGILDLTAPDTAGVIAFDTDALTPGEHVVTLTVTDLDGLSGEASVAFTVNDLPDAPTLGITPGTPTTDDDLVAAVLADGYDAEGDALSYTWAWSVDGAPTAYTTETVPAAATTRGEVWEVVATPNDGWGDGTAASASVTIGNAVPTLASATLSPDPAWEGATLTCSAGAASDTDGDGVSFTFAWEVNGLAIAATGEELNDTWWERGDTVACFVTPNDGLDAGVAVGSNVVTIDNSAPSITSVSISPSAPSAGDVLTCSVSGFSDPDGDADATTYSWSIDGVVVGTGDTLAGGFGGGDEIVCTATPYDGSATGTALSTSVTVANTAPELASVSLSPTSPTEADTLTCTPGLTTDADGTTSFTYSYSWTVGGAVIAATGETLDGDDFDAGDVVRCRAIPNDGTEDGAMVASSAVTIANTPPEITSATISPTSPDTDDTLTVSVSSSDLDGDAVSYTYAWYVNGAVAGTGASLSGSAFESGDAVYVVVTPTDGADSGAAYTSASVTVSNTAPVVASVSLTPTSPTEASTLTCAPSASDADGDALSYGYAWYVNGAAVGATSATLTGTYFSSGDAVYCRATASDGASSSAAVSSNTVTIGNTAPVLASVSLTPTTAYEASTLTCTPGATTDADGTTSFAYTYAWYVDGTSVAATSSTLSGSYFGRGDAVYCRVTPSDGTSSGSAVSSSTVTIANTAPVVSSVTLSPSSPTDADTISASVSSSDADGDSVSYTYAWYVNGSLVAATGSTLSSAYFAANDTVYASVTPTDGTTSGTAVASSSVTIANNAPVMASVSLTPTSAYEASTLTCTPSATDAEGDSISYAYAWYVNGSAIAATSSTLTGTSFGRGDSVYCRVTPSDSASSGTAMSSSTVTIGNTAPVLASATLTPTTAYEASTLTCTPAAATDADGDSVSYSYAWYVNGSLVAPTSSTLTGTYFAKSSTVYCRVTPSDGTTSGTAATSSTVTISNTAPVLASVSLTPTTAYEGSTLTCTPSSSDADGDSVSHTYAWYVNGSAVAATSSTLTGTYFSKSGTVYCRATPSDGTTSGTAMSSSTVTIGNSAPSAPTVVLTPADAEDDDALVCEIDTSATDADGDALTYTFTWTRNGSSYTGASATSSTSSTVAAAATSAGDTWACSATATDGSATSSAGTDSVEVLGTSYTIGYASVFATPGTGSAGANYSLCQSQVVSSSADIYALGLYLRLADTDSARMAVYTSVAGVPSTLVAYTALTSLSSYAAGSFVELDVVGAPVSISAGTYYICENLSGTAYLGYTTTGASGNTIYYNSLSSSSAFPTSFGSASSYTGQFLNLYMVVR